MKYRADTFDIEIDGQMIYKEFTTPMIFINNGKLGGGRNVINSHGVINDGLVEVEVMKDVTTLLEIKKLFDKMTKKGGIHVYH